MVDKFANFLLENLFPSCRVSGAVICISLTGGGAKCAQGVPKRQDFQYYVIRTAHDKIVVT